MVVMYISHPLLSDRVLSTAATLVLLLGCTTAQWENPDVPEAEWSSTTSYCRTFANREAEREARRTAGMGTNRSIIDQGKFDRQMATYDARKLGLRLFDRCMKEQGYVKVTRGR